MKKLVYIALSAILIMVGCRKTTPQPTEDVLIEKDSVITVAEICEWLNEDTFSVEAAAEWDSMNANSCGYLPIRCAERHLDTIINHYHVVFIPEP